MNKSLTVGMVFFFVILSPLFSQNNAEFKRVGQWKHDELLTHDTFSFIDKDNNLVAAMGRGYSMVMTPNKITKFGFFGQAPNDLTLTRAGFFYKGDLAIVEQTDKIKVFTRKGENYVWKETKWLKRGIWAHIIREGLFYDGKFFISGMEGISDETGPLKTFYKKYSHLKVYAENGDSLKQLIQKSFDNPTFLIELKYHLAGYHSDRVFFMPANELKVSAISTNTLAVAKEVQLEAPSFYKKMPETFYAWDENIMKKGFGKHFVLFDEWEMGYSSVQEMVVDGNTLVVQIRTANPKMKKFALLFYNADSFKLEKTVFLDDYLLDVKDGKYYTYQNGNPGLDDDTEECIINIYSFVSKK